MVAIDRAGEEVLTDAVRGSYISGEDLERLVGPACAVELPDLGPVRGRTASTPRATTSSRSTGKELDARTARPTVDTDSFDPGDEPEDRGAVIYPRPTTRPRSS